jgi:hypothetical protein
MAPNKSVGRKLADAGQALKGNKGLRFQLELTPHYAGAPRETSDVGCLHGGASA